MKELLSKILGHLLSYHSQSTNVVEGKIAQDLDQNLGGELHQEHGSLRMSKLEAVSRGRDRGEIGRHQPAHPAADGGHREQNRVWIPHRGTRRHLGAGTGAQGSLCAHQGRVGRWPRKLRLGGGLGGRRRCPGADALVAGCPRAILLTLGPGVGPHSHVRSPFRVWDIKYGSEGIAKPRRIRRATLPTVKSKLNTKRKHFIPTNAQLYVLP